MLFLFSSFSHIIKLHQNWPFCWFYRRHIHLTKCNNIYIKITKKGMKWTPLKLAACNVLPAAHNKTRAKPTNLCLRVVPSQSVTKHRLRGHQQYFVVNHSGQSWIVRGKNKYCLSGCCYAHCSIRMLLCLLFYQNVVMPIVLSGHCKPHCYANCSVRMLWLHLAVHHLYTTKLYN